MTWWNAHSEGLVLLANCTLAAVFLWAAAAKIRDWYGLLRTLRDQIGVPHRLARVLAKALPWLEVCVALGLLIGYARRAAAAGAVLLLCSFIAGLTTAWWKGKRQLKCNCFGETGEVHRTGWLVLRNLALLPAALLSALASPTPQAPLLETIAAWVTGLGILTAAYLCAGIPKIAVYRREVIARDALVAGGAR